MNEQKSIKFNRSSYKMTIRRIVVVDTLRLVLRWGGKYCLAQVREGSDSMVLSAYTWLEWWRRWFS